MATLRRRWWLVAGVLSAAVLSILVVSFLGKIPLPDAATNDQSSKVLAADGQLIGTLHAEENRTIVPIAKISPHLQKAVVATEDRKFYEHPGVSLRGILRAAFSNVKGGGVQQGGSTITQQYVRNQFEAVGRERTILRKIKEATLAVKIERKFSKRKILELYLNTVYFGRGAYGAEAAARTYFKIPAEQLSLGQAAYLAGIIRAPQLYQAEAGHKKVLTIRDEVLGDMVASGAIKSQDSDAAKKEDLISQFKFGASAEIDSPRAGYFMEFVRRMLKDEFDLTDKQILGGGLQIHTSLDLKMQDAAEAAIRSTLDRPDDPEAALIAMDGAGNVRAMVGGRDVTDLQRARGSNFAANLKKEDSSGRQAGSAFKPFTLAAFLDQGKSIKSRFPAPAQITIESQQCRDDKGNPWNVSNFDSEGFGQMDIVDATVRSVNTVYAQMADLVTPKRISDMTESSGVAVPRRERVCALSLGTSPVTPLEMARGYATFAQRGKRPEVIIVSKIVGPEGDLVAERKPKSEQKVDQKVADTVNYALQENINRGTGTGAKLNRPAAGKTGTTQNHVDAWFAGYTPELTAVVWMGYPPKDGKIPEMNSVRGRRVTGGSFPATIWKKFMTEALKGVKASSFAEPDLGGEVISPSPKPCPTESPTPSPVPGCIPPSPSPSPSPAVPSPVPSVAPTKGQQPTPTSSPPSSTVDDG